MDMMLFFCVEKRRLDKTELFSLRLSHFAVWFPLALFMHSQISCHKRLAIKKSLKLHKLESDYFRCQVYSRPYVSFPPSLVFLLLYIGIHTLFSQCAE